jgi:hypothetical protein
MMQRVGAEKEAAAAYRAGDLDRRRQQRDARRREHRPRRHVRRMGRVLGRVSTHACAG